MNSFSSKMTKYIVQLVRRHSYRFSDPHLTYRRIVESLPVSENRVKKWVSRVGLFFIISTGRTGTLWLSEVLNKISKSDILVKHEPIPIETWAHKQALGCQELADNYIKNFRYKELYLRVGLGWYNIDIYGEVNGCLRRHIVPLKEVFPNAQFIHLVRDGRDAIRSVMSRPVLTAKHPVYNETFIQPTAELTNEEWFQLSRFEKICWIWKTENEYIRKNTSFSARIEDITSSYSLFIKQILEPLGLELDEDVWQAFANNPKNMTKNYTIGSWEDWTTEQREQFIRICGKEMKEYGYKVEE